VRDWFKLVPLLCLLLGCTPQPGPSPSPSPTSEPTVEPTAPPEACPAPKPGRVASWRLHAVGNWTDATPLVKGCSYCAEIGLPTLPDGVTPRCDCPVRTEGDPLRPACELEATGGPVWTCPMGGSLVVNPANPYQAKCVTGSSVRVCDSTGEVCAGRTQ
jgi:hypothetical protein